MTKMAVRRVLEAIGEVFWLSFFEESCSKMAKSLEDGRLTAGVFLEIARFLPKISKSRGKTKRQDQ